MLCKLPLVLYLEGCKKCKNFLTVGSNNLPTHVICFEGLQTPLFKNDSAKDIVANYIFGNFALILNMPYLYIYVTESIQKVDKPSMHIFDGHNVY